MATKRMNQMTTKNNPDSFRDFAAEKLIGDENIQVYSRSVCDHSSECGEDCHVVSVYYVDTDTEVELGEVLDSSDDANAEIADRIAALA